MAQPPRKPKKPAGKRKAPESVDRPSTIDRMDKAIQDEVFRLRFTQGRHLHEIIDHLKAMGAEPPSRTALGRHLKGLSEQMKAKMDAELGMLSPAMQLSNTLAEAVVSKIGDADSDNKLRAIREMVQTKIFRMLARSLAEEETDPEGGGSDAKELFTMARAVQTLAQAVRTEDQRLREEVAAARAEERLKAEDERKAAAANIERVAKQRGVSKETFQEMRRFLLGEQA